MTNATDLHMFRVRTPSFLISVELTPEVKNLSHQLGQEYRSKETSLLYPGQYYTETQIS